MNRSLNKGKELVMWLPGGLGAGEPQLERKVLGKFEQQRGRSTQNLGWWGDAASKATRGQGVNSGFDTE